jgi:drug/metabolite transporter (DMT)-like permease
MNPKQKAALYTTLFVTLWAAVEMLGPYADVPGLEVVWFRYGTHLLCMLAFLGPRCRRSVVQTECPLHLHAVRSLMMLGMPAAYLKAASSMTVSNALAVFWSYPLILIAASQAMAQYRVRASDYLAAFVSLVGAVLILRPDPSVVAAAAVYPLAMGGCFIAYMVMTRNMAADSTATNLFHTALWVFAALTLYLPFIWRTPSLRGLLVLVAIGLLGLAGLYALDRAIHLSAPAAWASAGYLQLTSALLLEKLLYGRTVNALQALGATLIVVVAIVAHSKWAERRAVGVGA